MSTLAWELAGDIAPAHETEAKPGFWSRFIESREIRALRAGELRLPPIRQGG